MAYILKFGKKFDRDFEKIDKSISEQIIRKLRRLRENPENIGKPLSHTKPSLWEFKAEVFIVKDTYNSSNCMSFPNKQRRTE